MGTLFGTDGIRGKAGEYPMTVEMAVRIGRAVALTFTGTGGRSKIVVGRDTRQSGPMLESALVEGIGSAGTDTWLAGVIPTPGVAFLTPAVEANAGIVISASHNPYYDNGIKIFNGKGYKLSDEIEAEIEALIGRRGADGRSPSPGPRAGRATTNSKLIESYITFLNSCLPSDLSLKGLKVILDCANGATSRVAPGLFSNLGARVETLGTRPDGHNINDACGSEHPEGLIAKVLNTRAHLGLAFDGDGDRLIAVDENGGILTGDQILAICARDLKQKGRLKNDLVVSTVMSNMGLGVALQDMGIRHETAGVGDRYVMEKMIATGAVLGGEDSGHMIFADRHTSGDGILTALKLIEALQAADQPLSELKQVMTVYPQVLINVDVQSKPDLATVPAVAEAIKAVETKLGSQGRVLVRYSGTQPLCRVMVEGPSETETREYCIQLADIIKKKI
ncbi:MAG: phosphoglucosamine mutase [Deltaproteobacteria bacterium]|jgi:phosphoglucosamine mutase|nr:phosphoglucosamine mutase [Deltaproteobacteria bacterium]